MMNQTTRQTKYFFAGAAAVILFFLLMCGGLFLTLGALTVGSMGMLFPEVSNEEIAGSYSLDMISSNPLLELRADGTFTYYPSPEISKDYISGRFSTMAVRVPPGDREGEVYAGGGRSVVLSLSNDESCLDGIRNNNLAPPDYVFNSFLTLFLFISDEGLISVSSFSYWGEADINRLND